MCTLPQGQLFGDKHCGPYDARASRLVYFIRTPWLPSAAPSLTSASCPSDYIPERLLLDPAIQMANGILSGVLHASDLQR